MMAGKTILSATELSVARGDLGVATECLAAIERLAQEAVSAQEPEDLLEVFRQIKAKAVTADRRLAYPRTVFDNLWKAAGVEVR